MTRSQLDSTPAASVMAAAPKFDERYRAAAAGDRAQIPWENGAANPLVVDWLDHRAADVLRTGARVAVVGCGLGHDARAFARRGYDVSAFDVSPAAIEWAKSIDPEWSEIFSVADLFELPSRWKRRFDLVVEVYTVQALPPATRKTSLAAIESLLHPHGALLFVCRGADRPQQLDDGPPWALTVDELRDLASGAGLAAPDGFELVTDDEDPPKRRIRALFRRTTAR
ncbi:MAG: methyltransferase domain-containing protein [Phycisphaerales bacterium]